MSPARVPSATYRLQLNRSFNFVGASAIVDYLWNLGITDGYASPIFTTRPGSMHGYDVVDHGQVNPDLGSESEFMDLGRKLRDRGMGLVLDVVPNHMCIADPGNRWWNDVLENGPSSPMARHFDIDWNPPKADLVAKVLLPILGDQFGRVLENQQIRVEYEAGAFVLRCYDMRLPVAPRTWGHVLQPALQTLRPDLGEEHAVVLEMESIITALDHLPLRTETDPARVRERQREKEVIKRRLDTLLTESADARRAVDASLGNLNGAKDDPSSLVRLERLLDDQGYRLSFWRVASDEINYRRFFDINELAAIRVEEPDVFAAVHDLVLRMAREGLVTGLRIDHVDGLFDPDKYLRDLQDSWAQATGREATDGRPCYVVVEKILGSAEPLRSQWPVHGTTGYEFLNLLGGLFVHPDGAGALRSVAERFTGNRRRFADIAYESKKLVLRAAMSSELTVLARKLDLISEQHRFSRDFTLNSLQDALRELIACFPVYRTYVRAEDPAVSPADRREIEIAIREARRRNPATSASIFDFLASVLLREDPDGLDEAARAERRDFALRLQQLTGPVMAKGVEDTAFYRYFPLAALNEVGGEPDRGGVTLDEFHRRNGERLQRWPDSLSATATHDGKRGEDVRARLAVLSEIPRRFGRTLERWQRLNRPHRVDVGGMLVPDPSEEYLLYQTLIGTWPTGGNVPDATYRGRIQQYMQKALREAKLHTSWISPNEVHDKAVETFVDAVLDPGRSAEFLADLARLVESIERPGMYNALCQVLLKITAPGVPDFYQGTEVWDLSLVDPDNRRPVDWGIRRALLAQMDRDAERGQVAAANRLLRRAADGRIKLWVTSRALRFRRAHADLFRRGWYLPLNSTGPRADNVVAFARASAEEAAVVVTTRFFTKLRARWPQGGGWEGTSLALRPQVRGERFRDVLTGVTIEARGPTEERTLALGEVLANLPVALLEAIP